MGQACHADEPWPGGHPHTMTCVTSETVRDEQPATPATEADGTEQRLLRSLVPARELRLGATARDRLWGWLGPAAVALLAAVLRLVDLGRPGTLVFDETYYVKGAYTLLMEGYEADWPEEPDANFERGVQQVYLDRADYVVHPPVGKWMIALGLRLAGPENPWAWRLVPALVGVVAVFLLARTARQVLGSTPFGVIAGGLFAIDGVGIVHARTGLLDSFLMFWVLVAFACLVADRSWARRRLASRMAALLDAGDAPGALGPGLGWRWWRFAAAVALGLACGTKWSGLYFVAVLCLLSVGWDAAARRTVGVRRWLVGAVLRDAVPAAATMLPVVLVTYVASWSAWFADARSYGRDWWVTHPRDYPAWWPDALDRLANSVRSLWAYHAKMLDFHRGLSTPHDYEANPWGWLLQLQPTSFYWRKTVDGAGGCGADVCVRAITSLGNPIIWWLATAAVLLAVYGLLRWRDWRAGAVLAGIVAGWVPWLFFAERTIFTFYTIAFAPWMYLALAWALAAGWERLGGTPMAHRQGRWAIGVLLAILVGVSAFFYPIWTAVEVPIEFWRAHMWLGSWIK